MHFKFEHGRLENKVANRDQHQGRQQCRRDRPSDGSLSHTYLFFFSSLFGFDSAFSGTTFGGVGGVALFFFISFDGTESSGRSFTVPGMGLSSVGLSLAVTVYETTEPSGRRMYCVACDRPVSRIRSTFAS